MRGEAAEGQPKVGPGISTTLAVLLACAVLLPLLGHRVLTDWDEGIYAEIAREMLGGGARAWLVPHWNGQLWFEKPPLLMWAQAVSLRIFGLNAFAARLPSAAAGVAIVGLLHRWTLRRVGMLAAWLGTVCLLCSFGFQHVARAGETDTLLSLGCLVAVVGLAEVWAGREAGWWAFWVGFAVALMTKGAASVVLPGVVVLLWCTGPRRLRLGRSFWLGLVLFLALVLPWHLLLWHWYGQAFWQEYLGFHVLSRATVQIEGHRTHPWFYVWVLLVSAPLFSLLYPVSGWAAFVRADLRVLRPFAVFASVEFLLFSAVQTRLPHYIAPMYPAGSALVGAWLAFRWERLGASVRANSAGALAGLAAVYLLCALATAGPRRALHSPRMGSGLLNPDNRESAALLERARRSSAGVAGPLLVLRNGAVMPLQTDAFYAQRLVQPVWMEGVERAQADRYNGEAEPLEQVVPSGQSRLMLMDRALLGRLPSGYSFEPLATGREETVGLLQHSTWGPR